MCISVECGVRSVEFKESSSVMMEFYSISIVFEENTFKLHSSHSKLQTR